MLNHSTTARTTRLGAPAFALISILGTAACTSNDKKATPSAAESTTAATSTSQGAGLPSGVEPGDIPTEVPNDTALRKGVAVTSCKAVTGGWGAEGTAKNSGSAPRKYTITIFFTTAAATTIDSAATSVDVPPGETVKWAASKKFKAAETMLCVLRGVA